MGAEPVGCMPDEAAKFLRDEMALWAGWSRHPARRRIEKPAQRRRAPSAAWLLQNS
jgi:hypothetical protein